MTYVALGLLLMMGDDLSRVNKKLIATSLSLYQQKDGSFSPTRILSECDMRYVYCACCVAHILDDWSGIDKDLSTNYILSSQSYDYSIGQVSCLLRALSLLCRDHNKRATLEALIALWPH